MRHDGEWAHVEVLPWDVHDDPERLRAFITAAETRARVAITASPRPRAITEPVPVVDVVYVRAVPGPARPWWRRRSRPAWEQVADRADADAANLRVVFTVSARVGAG